MPSRELLFFYSSYVREINSPPRNDNLFPILMEGVNAGTRRKGAKGQAVCCLMRTKSTDQKIKSGHFEDDSCEDSGKEGG